MARTRGVARATLVLGLVLGGLGGCVEEEEARACWARAPGAELVGCWQEEEEARTLVCFGVSGALAQYGWEGGGWTREVEGRFTVMAGELRLEFGRGAARGGELHVEAFRLEGERLRFLGDGVYGASVFRPVVCALPAGGGMGE